MRKSDFYARYDAPLKLDSITGDCLHWPKQDVWVNLPRREQHGFPSTRWTRVRAARNFEERETAMQEFSALCASYWYPLYGFARHKGCSLEDASDLTQEFFAILSEGDLLAKADPEKGKLRALFLTVFSRQMATARERAGALKRGGANVVVSIDQFSAEERLVNDPVDPKETPEKWYDRQWALVVLDCCLDQLGLEMVSRGKADEFAALRPFLRLSEVGTASRAEAARALDLQPNTVGKKIRLLQERFIAILKRHVAESLANPTPEAVEEEIRCLRNAVALEG